MNFREVDMFRPYANEFPEELLQPVSRLAKLLWQAGADATCVARWQEAEMLRIAKIGEDIVACYAMDRGSELTFVLHGVVVDPAHRKQGLGRWVVGHAIGVAESKGGRHLSLPAARGSRLFERIGFVRDDGDLRFDLIPE